MNKKNYFLYILVTLSSLLVLNSCHKEGIGGRASIKGSVYHHAQAVPFATVYVKFAAKEFPGTDINLYDANVTCNAAGEFEINKLYKGDYYLYGTGFDSKVNAAVQGGLGVNLHGNKAYTHDVFVTEVH